MEKPLKVLAIGNSFSICVLRWLPQVLRELGAKGDIASLFIGGCSLLRHFANLAAAERTDFRPYLATWHFDSVERQGDAPFVPVLARQEREDGSECFMGNIPAMLAGDRWDVVTIQQASPESWNWNQYLPWADLLIDCIKANAPQAEIVIQQTWSYCIGDRRISDGAGGPGTWGFDQRGMYERLTECYDRLAAAHGLRTIPTGDAVQLYRERRPVTKLSEDLVGSMTPDANGVLTGDPIHFNNDGVYLQACVWAAELFGLDVTRLRETATPRESLLSPEMAPLMRTCAMDAVAARRAARG